MIWLAVAAFAGVPAGESVSEGLAVDVTPEGFAAVGDLATSLIPAEVAVPGFSDYGDECWLIGGYWDGIEVSGIVVTPTVQSVSLVPGDDGWIDVDAVLEVAANSAAAPFSLHTELACIGDTCDGHIDPFLVEVHTGLRLLVETDAAGEPVLVSELEPIEIVNGLVSDDIALEGCSISGLEDFVNFFGGSIYDLILPLVDDAILGAVDGLSTDLEATLDDALVVLKLDETVALDDTTTLHLELAPTAAQTTGAGMRLVLGGSVTTGYVDPCVADYDPGESFAVPGPIPAIGSAPVAVPPGHHIGLAISDEFANQALYAVWQTGLICQELGADSGLELPIALDTTLLGLLVGDIFAELFPEPQPLTIRTRPESAPTLSLTPDRMGVSIQDLGLELYSEIDGRQARILDVALDVDAGLGLGFDPTTGLLDLTLDLADAVDATTTLAEFTPGAEAEIEGSLVGALESGLIAGILEGVLQDLALGLPSFSGFGVSSLTVAVAGDDADWVGAYLTVGEVDYVSSGCGTGCGTGSSSSGCGGSSSGCSSASGCGSTSGCASSVAPTGGSTSGCDCGETTATPTSTCDASAVGIARTWVIGLTLAATMRRRRRR